MHPSKNIATWALAVWVLFLVLQPERTTTVTANVLTTVVGGIADGLSDVDVPTEHDLPKVKAADGQS